MQQNIQNGKVAFQSPSEFGSWILCGFVQTNNECCVIRNHYSHIGIALQWRQSLDVSHGGCCQKGSQLREETVIFDQMGVEQHRHHGGQVPIRQLTNRSKIYVSRNVILYIAWINVTNRMLQK